MKTLNLLTVGLVIILLCSCKKDKSTDLGSNPSDMIINHNCTKLFEIPQTAIENAKATLHIAYGHTSHGSQITDGMSGLATWKGSLYAWNNGGTNGALDIQDFYGNFGSSNAQDLGNPNYIAWETATRSYLNSHSKINVIMWSWCGEVSNATEDTITKYCTLMNKLEKDFPNVKFVYMTGHLDGSGLTGNLHLRNEQIRKYCKDNHKILYDFNDIESYNPDGVYFGDKKATDACTYDSNNDGLQENNWAIEWQNSHIEGTDWYQCGSVHSQPLNANQKAYAAWWMWARIAGWDGN
ncbi:MAG TPA: hypothetical protein VIH57_03745 [Bacteroidales bacterium]